MSDLMLVVLSTVAIIVGVGIAAAILSMLVVLLLRVNSIKDGMFTMSAQLAQVASEQSLQNFMSAQDGSDASAPLAAIPTLYRSADGRYTAGSMTELYKKILDDPHNGLDEDQMEQLRRLFERMVNEDDSPDSPPETPGDEWKRKKK